MGSCFNRFSVVIEVFVMVMLDPTSVRYASGATNMHLFAQRVPARYLSLFQDGPAILYEYTGSEHLASTLPTVDEIRCAEGLCHISSGGDVPSASARFANEIQSVIQDHDPSIDSLGVDRFPMQAIDALRDTGLKLVDADPALAEARKTKLAEKAWPVPDEHQDSRYYCIGHGLSMSGRVPQYSSPCAR